MIEWLSALLELRRPPVSASVKADLLAVLEHQHAEAARAEARRRAEAAAWQAAALGSYLAAAFQSERLPRAILLAHGAQCERQATAAEARR